VSKLQILASKHPQQTVSLRENYAHCVRDSQGPILEHCQQGAIIADASLCCEMYDKLKPVIQSERQGLLLKCVLLLHNDARPFTAVQSV